jgi:N-acetylneuraminic acid mutarotase
MGDASQELNWERLPDMPAGKWEPASLVIDDKLVVLGGYADYIMSSRRVDLFDPADNSWTQLQDLPSALSHVNLVTDSDGKGFWFAGGMKDKRHPGKDHIIAEVWQFDPDLDRYSAAPLLPGRRAGGGLERVGGRLHYVSGLMADRDTDAPEHWVFDLDAWHRQGDAAAAHWTEAAPIPLPRNQLAVAVLGGKIYAIGGQLHHDSEQIDQSRVDIYDPERDAWQEGPPLPYGHSHSEGATFVHDDHIYMLAGHTTPTGGKKGFCANILRLREGGVWELIGQTPKPVSSPAAAIIGERLYVAGGWDGRMDEKKRWLSSPEVWAAGASF